MKILAIFLFDFFISSVRLCLPGSLEFGMVYGSYVLCKDGGVGLDIKITALTESGASGIILYGSPPQNLALYKPNLPAIVITPQDGLKVKAYISSSL